MNHNISLTASKAKRVYLGLTAATVAFFSITTPAVAGAMYQAIDIGTISADNYTRPLAELR